MPDSLGPSSASPSRLGRLGRFLFLATAALIAILVMVGLFENWRGRRDWKAFRAHWQAKGETFDVVSLVPPSPPPEQNFAATPLLAPLLNYYKPANQPVQWNDPQGNARARALGDVFKAAGRKKPPMFGQWQSCL